MAGLLNWFPALEFGSYTSAGQAAWSVTGNSDYLVLGGEFPSVNGTPQQGLVRFAKGNLTTNKLGPIFNSGFNPTPVPTGAGSMRIAFTSLWDRDDKTLTYDVYRQYSGSSTTSRFASATSDSNFWSLPGLSVVDTGLTPGAQVRYQVRAKDAAGNVQWSAWSGYVAVASTDAVSSSYVALLKQDGASHLWRLGESSGTAAVDEVGDFHAAYVNMTLGNAGALSSESNAAAKASASTGKVTTTDFVIAPQTFSIEAWVKTTSTRGGRIIGFGNSPASTSTSTNSDRVLYLDTSGRVNFGIYSGGYKAVTSRSSVNDGQWHQVVGTLDPSAGMQLFVDGQRVGRDQRYVTAKDYDGYWRIGADMVTSFTNAPSDTGLVGTYDEVAVYPKALTLAQVQSHYLASGRSQTWPAQVSDAYGTAVVANTPDVFWRLSSVGSTVADYSGSGHNGNVSGVVSGGQAGAISTDTAALFNGSTGVVVDQQLTNAPQAFTTELWFKTTTNRGGKLVGFGTASSGLSASYDRHVWMLNSGQVAFGTDPGSQVILTSPSAYNDGQWHYLVASQDGSGMKLWLDATLVGSNNTSTAQAYNGYWRIGGDNVWSGSSRYFAGTLDEVAIYPTALAEDSLRAHYQAAGRAAPNRAPVASFAPTADFLNLSVDASASSDPDGPVASYNWNFGDGGTATGVTATHSYAAAGTHTVKLTVVDAQGLTNSTTRSVTVGPNQAPVASFTSTATFLSASFDGSASSDTDGSVVGYSWDFGDGTTGTGATATHAFGAAGTYHVVLTVSDNRGLTGSVAKDVTVVANQAPTASFTSTVTNRSVGFDASASADADGTVASYAWTFGDGSSGTGVTPTHTYAAAGDYLVTLVVTDDVGSTGTVTKQVTATDPPNQAPTASFTSSITDLTLAVNGSASVDADGTVALYSWDFGDSTSGTGATATHAYTTAGTYTVTLTVTDGDGATASTSTQVTATKPNQKPTASFTSTVTNLKVAFDGTASSDSDGSIASYAWDFGDNGTDTTASPNHTYAASGTYTVKLTVTDNKGATDTATKSVTVAAAGPLAQDDFGRTVAAGGWGTADTGGSWSVASGASKFSVSGGTGNVTLAAGSSGTVTLPSVTSSDVDMTVSVSMAQAATGGGQYVALIGRQVSSSNDYRIKARVLAGGAVTLYLAKTVAGTETVLTNATVSGLSIGAGDVMLVRAQVSGNGTTSLKAKAWKSGSTEPSSWATSTTDTTAGLQATGSVGLYSYVSGSTTNGPVTFSYDGLVVKNTP